MTQITFSRLRDSDDWGLRGSKDSPDEKPPQEGTSVTVTKKSGEQQEVVMGRVIAQGDDWWLAASGASNNTATCRACACDSCISLMAKVKRLVASMDDQADAADATSNNYTERRLAQEQADQTERDAIAGEGADAKEANPWA